jgi:hypothetical protein
MPKIQSLKIRRILWKQSFQNRIMLRMVMNVLITCIWKIRCQRKIDWHRHIQKSVSFLRRKR